jgi:hypothetical protein
LPRSRRAAALLRFSMSAGMVVVGGGKTEASCSDRTTQAHSTRSHALRARHVTCRCAWRPAPVAPPRPLGSTCAEVPAHHTTHLICIMAGGHSPFKTDPAIERWSTMVRRATLRCAAAC